MRIKTFNNFIFESLDKIDIKNNLPELGFDLNGQRCKIKVNDVKRYEFHDDKLYIYLALENNSKIQSNVKICVGDSMNDILLYGDDFNSKGLITSSIVDNTKSWLLSLKDKLEK